MPCFCGARGNPPAGDDDDDGRGAPRADVSLRRGVSPEPAARAMARK